MLLAVLMVMSVVPASVIASAASPTATFTAPTTSLVTFSTDTSETSEIIRVAGGEGMFTHGTTIVAATPSGIPKSDSGQYISVAYAGETPAFPKVVFKITGVEPDAPPTIVSTLGSNGTLVLQPVNHSGNVHTYTWLLTGGNATQGTVVTYTITYKINGTQHETYAYSFVENILIMNGYVSHKYQNGGDHTPDTRHAYSVNVGARNMYPGWYNNMAENIGRGFINYGAGSAKEGGSLLGTGTSPEGFASTMEGFAVDDGVTTTGTPYGSMIKTISNQSKDDWVNVAYGLNGNRTESYLYLDKRNETLDNLKFRVSLQACDSGNEDGPWPYTDFQDVEILSGAVEFGSADQWDMSAGTNQSYVNNKTTSLIRIGEITKNVDKTRITSIDPGQSHRYAWFGGTGPALQDGQTKYQNTLLVYANEMASNSNGETWNQEIGALGITFVVYDTTDLYNIFYGIMKGANLNGSASYTCSNIITYVANAGETRATTTAPTVTFNKGAHPQKSYYTGGWDAFLTAYQEAGRQLSKPDTNQTAINNAAVNLINAYNNLQGFNPQVNYTIKHVIAGTATEIVNASTAGYTAAAQTGTVAAGTKITAYSANITGYEVDGDTTKSITATGAKAEETITFNYKPKKWNVNAQTNNEALEKYVINGTETNVRVQIYSVDYGTYFNKSTATNGDGDPTRPGVGTRKYWEFIDWYFAEPADGVSWDETQRVPASFEMLDANRTIYARWDTAPIHMYATPMLDDGTVINNGKNIDLGYVKPNADGSTVLFNRPAESVMTVSGYLFVGYYEKYTSTFEGSVEWPVEFKLGDNDKTIVARYADVNGKIVFEPNGGSACPDYHFTVGQTINESDLPVPTRVGYQFDGWYKDPNFTAESEVFKDGATSFVQNSQTGFIAYAKWSPKQLIINFDTALGAKPSKYDTKTISPRVGIVGQPLDEDQIPANPRRFGYTFAGWVYNNRPFSFDKLPVADDEITVEATWAYSEESAFIELNAIEKVLGQENYLDTDDTTEDDNIVQHGDTITVRMTSQTNFNVGSSLFIFMYDKNFYELVGSGKDAFTLNSEDSYIGGIDARYTAVTNSNALPWPEGLDKNTYNAIQIAIDPTVSADNFNCEPMDGKTWMVEFKLKVKDNATGEGTIYMDNAWTRTVDNIMGTMFYGWGGTDAETTVIDTENNRVTPDLSFASRTLKIASEEAPKTSVNLDANGGAWADGDTTKSYTNGNAGSEIAGYTRPEKLGYILEENAWYAVAGDTTSEQWIEGFYPAEDATATTYYANWTAREYPVVFHWDQNSEEIYTTINVPYESDIAADAVAAPARQGYAFNGWTDAEGNLVTLPAKMNVADDAGYHLYATWGPATDTKFSVKVYYPTTNEDPENPGSYLYTSLTQTSGKNGKYQGTTGQTVALVTAVPANPDPDVLYLTVDELGAVLSGNYIFDPDAAGNAPDENGYIDSTVIYGDGSGVLEVYFIGKIITLTFNANGGTFPDGTDTLVVEGRFLESFAGLKESELPTKDGYDFGGFGTLPTQFNANRTFTAKWNPKAVHVRFMLNETVEHTVVETTIGKAPTAPAEPTKFGYTFVGWNTDPNATTGVKTLPAVNNADGADGYAITYYAIFVQTPYTLEYILDGESYGSVETHFAGDQVTILGKVDKPGYNFNGWIYNGTDITGTVQTMPADNVTITGSYTAKEINVKFYPGDGAFAGGEAYIEVASTFDGSINVPAEAQYPSKAGYTFIGWSADPDATTGSKDNLGTLTAEEASFYAIYEPEVHTYYIDVYEMGLDGKYPADPTRTETATAAVDSDVTITSTNDVEGFTLVTAETQTGTVPATGELRFTVKYERNKYDLVYVVEGDETVVEYFFGETIDASKAPATNKKGWSFTAWDPAVPATMPAGDVTVTAQFSINSYKVTYYRDADATTPERTESVVYDTDIPFVELYDTASHTFLGWAYAGTTDVVVSKNSAVKISDSDVTLVGIWQPKEFRLTYAGAEYFMVKYGTPVSEWPVSATTPEKEGNYFDGWAETTYTTMPASPVTIQPIWVAEEYILRFENTGDTVMADIPVTFNQEFDGVDDPAKAGHVFAGWDDEIPTTIGDLGNNGAVIVFTADWTPETYTLKFAATGDTTIGDKNVTFGDTIEAVANPEWAGHVFLNWDKPVPTQITDLGNDKAVITYTAQWKTEEYTLKFANTGDTVINDKIVTYGQTIAKVADPTWAGYVFAGWDVTPPTTIGDLGDDGAVITYTANWTRDKFTITFDSNGGTSVAPITEDFETVINAPTAPTRTGAVFSHWINVEDNSVVTFPIQMPSANLNLKAIWTAETYTIIFADTNDAGDSIEMPVTYGDTIVIPTGLTKTGYIFTKWDVTPSTTIGDLGENGTVVTYTAQWAKKTYTLKFVDTGDTTIADKTVKFGDTIEVPTNLKKEGQGYYFTNTWKDANGNVVTPPTTINDMGNDGAEFTYVAQWAKETYTINFNTDGGTAVEPIVEQYGNRVIVPANPTKAGHEFIQWNDAEGNKYTIQQLMPDLGENNATITLKAEWKKLVYTVTFFDAYGSVYTTAQIEFDSDIAAKVPAELPQKEHYTTLGWSTVQGDTVAITDFGKMPAKTDLAYYPVLERVKVTLALKEGSTAEVFETNTTDPEITYGLIRGLDTQLTKTDLEETYLGVTGDGTLRITPSWNRFNICGTGTMVEVYDNVDNKVVEIYFIVVYGDLNGDSGISAADIPVMNLEMLGNTGWSDATNEEYNKALTHAADLKKDGSINGIDATMLRDVTLSVAYIDQATGVVSYY